MIKSGILISYILMCSLSIFCVNKLSALHTNKENVTISYLASLPEPVAKIVALEFPGLFSDYLLLNTLTFMGEKVLTNRTVSEKEWKIVYQSLKQIINLDPRGVDAFTLAETTLPWEAGMIEETNTLLLQVAQVQTDNYRPYFFLWFNHYYFLQDPKKAGYYLQKAAKITGTPNYYATLAARMQLMAGKYSEAINFLQEIINETTDINNQKYLKRRMRALMMLDFLEKNILRYEKKYNKKPAILEDLVTHGIIREIRQDPYKGTFYIMDNGRVYTTSNLVLSKDN